MALTRINNNISALNANRNLRMTTRDLSISLERLSSGLRINRAADDAAGLTIAENLRAQINGLNQAIDNSSSAINLVNTAEGALIETTSRLHRIRTLAVQAANRGTNDSVALQAIQDEIEASIQEISRIADTTQFATRKLLNGDNQNTATVTGGSNLGVSVSPDPINSTLSSGLHFLSINQTDAGSETLSTGLDGIDNTGATNFTGSTFPSGTYDITLGNVVPAATRQVELDMTIDSPAAANLVGTVWTDEASNTHTVAVTDVVVFSGQNSDGDSWTYTYTVGASFNGAGLATNMQAAVRAVTPGNLDTVAYDNTTGTWVLDAAAPGPNNASISVTIDALGGGAPVEWATGQVVNTAGALNTAVLVVGDGPAQTVTAGDTVTAYGQEPSDPRIKQPEITFTLGSPITEGSDTLTVVEQAYTGQLDGGQSLAFQNGDRNIQFRSGTAAGTPSGETVKMDFDAVIDLGGGTSRTFVLSAVNNGLVFQIGANAGQSVSVAFGDLRATNLGFSEETQPNGNQRVVSQINVTTLTGANEAIAIVDEAIRQVNEQRSALGAFANRLEATISNLGVASENLTSSESRIRDADMATETSRFTRNQILVQAGISVLSQANSLPQSVLSLLQ